MQEVTGRSLLLDFALVQLENLHHILDFCSNFRFTAVDIDV